MSTLDSVGDTGANNLKQILTTCTDPIEAITNFQSQNSIKCPTLAPALKLLDLLNVRRAEYHSGVMDALKERLVSRVRELSSNSQSSSLNDVDSLAKLNTLVIKSFPFINIPHLRPIVLEALGQIPKLPEQFLDQVKRDRKLYDDVAMEVKQQIWLDDEDLFFDEIEPVIKSFLMSKRLFFVDLTSCFPNFYIETNKSRRQNVYVRRLGDMIGKYKILYDRLLSKIRRLFAESNDEHLCSLRSEILMLLREKDAQDLLAADPCHKFVWCLDACLRDKHLDPKHAAELKGILDSVTRKNKEKSLLPDLSMTVADPYVLHFLNQLIAKVVGQCLANEVLPRENGSLQLLLRLATLGAHAFDLVSGALYPPDAGQSAEYKEPKIESIMYTKFLACLMTAMAQDQYAAARKNARSSMMDSSDTKGIIFDSKFTVTEDDKTVESISVDSILEPFIKSDPLCCRIVLYYFLEVVKKRQTESLPKLLNLVSRSHFDFAYRDSYLHLLVYNLTSMADHLGLDDEVFDCIFGKFLLKKVDCWSIKFQLAKLAFFCGSKLPKIKRDYLLECLHTAMEADAKDSTENVVEFANDLASDKIAKTFRNDETIQYKSDADTFVIMVKCVERKFEEIENLENEVETAAENPAPPAAINSRSLSEDFPDVPTPMTPASF